MNYELGNVIIGMNKILKGHSIQTILCLLRKIKTASGEIEKSKLFFKMDKLTF